jgi:hypothetical protein
VFERIFKSSIGVKKMDLIQILFSAAVIYGLYKLVRVYRKKEEILPEKPMAKVEPVKKKKIVKKIKSNVK